MPLTLLVSTALAHRSGQGSSWSDLPSSDRLCLPSHECRDRKGATTVHGVGGGRDAEAWAGLGAKIFWSWQGARDQLQWVLGSLETEQAKCVDLAVARVRGRSLGDS